MSSSKNGVHILVFPFPAQGHMLPLLDLTHQLSLRNLTITILITPKNLPILTPLLSANPCIQTLILPFPKDPSVPPGVENVKDLGYHGIIPIFTALTKLQEPIIQWFKSHSNPPVALISDIFFGWTHHLANHLGIPRLVFYSSGAFAVAVFDHLWIKCDDVKIGSDVEFLDLPGSPSFPWDHLSSVFRRYRQSSQVNNNKNDYSIFKNSVTANMLSWGFVYNTFEALEGEFLDHSSKILGCPRVYSVGPLNMVSGSHKLRVDNEKHEVISWLDGCENGSVLYVCFGSQKLLKKAQMEALAVGLERSGVKFIWVVKSLSAQQVEDGYGSVPDGFEERVSGQGFVLKGWAPQIEILSHRGVGGFLSHCGWNSMLEAIAAGVMILCWPMEADQFVDAKLLVEYKGAAVLVCEGGDTVPDSDELARKISESMHGAEAERERTKEMRNKALEAVNIGGSSNRGLDGLVQELAKL